MKGQFGHGTLITLVWRTLEEWKKRMLYERRNLRVMCLDCKTYAYYVIYIFIFHLLLPSLLTRMIIIICNLM